MCRTYISRGYTRATFRLNSSCSGVGAKNAITSVASYPALTFLLLKARNCFKFLWFQRGHYNPHGQLHGNSFSKPRKIPTDGFTLPPLVCSPSLKAAFDMFSSKGTLIGMQNIFHAHHSQVFHLQLVFLAQLLKSTNLLLDRQ